jgi:hypothetical protein
MAGKKMTEILGTMKDITILEPSVKLTSSVDDTSRAQLKELAAALAETLK